VRSILDKVEINKIFYKGHGTAHNEAVEKPPGKGIYKRRIIS
jgi:hypothetical protein